MLNSEAHVEKTMTILNKTRTVSTWMLSACGVWLVGLGFYFIILRPPLLPEDVSYMGTSLGEIQSALPGLERWLQHVFTVMGGFMMGAGVLTMFVATNATAAQEKWTWVVLALAGLFTVGTMSLTNFQLDSAFKWLLLIPALLWFIGLVLRIVIRRMSKRDER